MFSMSKAQHLGEIYRLIEQFELISRTDLAKLSGLAPASVTNLTKILIDNHFILERTVQNSATKGRPAVGLAVSPFFWQLLCLTISAQKIEISLCELNGKQIYKEEHSISTADYAELQAVILQIISAFEKHYFIDHSRLLAVSISVIGKINPKNQTITQLGHYAITCEISTQLANHFACPILLSEHFQLWLLAESTLGSLMNHHNVIFLQLDDTVNLSVLMQGGILNSPTKMNVDKMLMPRFSPLSDEIFPELDHIHRYQLVNQITFLPLTKLIDRYLPNSFITTDDKINWLCQKINENQPLALQILEHITDNLAYAIMNLVNIFSSEKMMLNSPLLNAKEALFQQLSTKLRHNLRQDGLTIDLATSHYSSNSTLITCAAIKQGIYEGNLIKDSTTLPYIR